jgi:uncharacterized tellurite resistance protein B-like protein
MIKNITKFFEEFMNPAEAKTSTGDDAHSIQFATAALLMEVSRSDEGHKEVEKDAILSILQRLFEFSDIEVAQLMDLAEDASEEAHDLYSFTRLINDHYDYSAKEQLVVNMWEIAFADGRVDAFEEHIIRRISGLVHLANEDFIRAKIVARKAMGS